ncbi:hypothetical protein DFP72DRAFT_986781 [Ephemerocybe angulata]|uniref:Hemerythrin-like domain-containing protein n=1 Tax=Ephemerocybe angulata TaxID=980116 RepID=A0A8H6IEV1_9AGAR|nr:hypothetical protein DFP72DRAFT_986781 [Tulosesus angulatus]
MSSLNDPATDALESLRRERRMNKLSDKMNQFHSYFKVAILPMDLSKGKGLSLPAFLRLMDDLIHHLTMHHTIEERYLFPTLGKKMPQFSDRETKGEHLESHKQIHEGLDKLSDLIKRWSSEPSTYSPAELKTCLDGFRGVLFRHLDDEVADLRGENLSKYFTEEEVARFPI